MKKTIILLILIVIATAGLSNAGDVELAFISPSIGGCGVPESGACSPDCNGVTLLGGVDTTLGSSATLGSTTRWRAVKILAATVDSGEAGCLKLYVASDGDDSSETLGIAIYSHDSGNDRPDTLIASNVFTNYDWTTIGDAAVHSFVVDQCFNTVDATDYWVAFYNENSLITVYSDSAGDEGDEVRYTATGQSASSPPAGSAYSSSAADKTYAVSIW